jgi:hypothetical protein
LVPDPGGRARTPCFPTVLATDPCGLGTRHQASPADARASACAYPCPGPACTGRTRFTVTTRFTMSIKAKRSPARRPPGGAPAPAAASPWVTTCRHPEPPHDATPHQAPPTAGEPAALGHGGPGPI